MDPESLEWHRVRVALRNTRNLAAREHPLFVMRAILKFARATGGVRPESRIIFRMLHPPGRRIRKDGLYRMDLLFPGRDYSEAGRLTAGLSEWLADPAHHYRLESVQGPEPRNLARLREEHPLDDSGDEVALDFITPLSFKPAGKDRPWSLRPGRLAAMLARRMEAAGGGEISPPEADLRLLPWYVDQQETHVHRKDQGVKELLTGVTGPIYLRGDWQAWEPWLRIASEWLLGSGTTRGQGAFQLLTARPRLDRLLPDRGHYRRVWEEYVHNTDRGDPFTHACVDPEAFATQMAEGLAAGDYEPQPARGIDIPKPSGGTRRIHRLEAPDAIAQRALHEMLSPFFERLMRDVSIGFRPGRSVKTARERVGRAIQDGCDHVLESDIENFFDQIPWPGLEQALDRVLPRGDYILRQLLARVMRQPTHDGGSRSCGLLQGGPLSPLVANVFLTPLDEGMEAAGFEHFIRYGDDFVVLTAGIDEARRALETVRGLAQALGLTLKDEKTAIRATSLGFRFLGLDLGGDSEDEVLEQAALRRHVILRAPWGFAGIDHDCLIVRRKGHDHVRIPFARIGELAFHGPFGTSTTLLNACTSKRIPVTFCTAAGHHLNTLLPNHRKSFAAASLHDRAWRGMDESERLRVAVSAVAAKLEHHARWLGGLPDGGAREAAAALGRTLGNLPKAASTRELMGMEGAAAKLVFPVVNRLVRDEEFRSQRREPRKKTDRWNALLDFGYSQLFSHLNVLVRGQGLNPYLGFLHSPSAHFESLVADLQEPFRPRVDRWAVRCVNLGIIRPEHFEWRGEQAGWHLNHEAFPIAIEQFARELDRRLGRDPGTLLELMRGQVLNLKGWTEQSASLRFEPPSQDS